MNLDLDLLERGQPCGSCAYIYVRVIGVYVGGVKRMFCSEHSRCVHVFAYLPLQHGLNLAACQTCKWTQQQPHFLSINMHQIWF